MSKILGILGGMGPLATVNFFEKIILLTEAKSDQDNIHILIDNNTSIPDRSGYLINGGDNPGKYLVESACRLEAMGADFLAMPCNTAHYFYEDIVKNINIPFLNMVEETAKHIVKEYPGASRAGLLATDGTCKAGIYDKVFVKYGIEIIKPASDMQKYVSGLIYDIKNGFTGINLEGYYTVLEKISDKADVVILGCTELPLAHERFKIKGDCIDTVKILAVSAIRFAGKKVKDIDIA
ncbi:MAG: amino acid racemase [Ruminiclostridium sp.]|nr:amino acid racemase [Ruminiclostridium sp.]